MVAFRAEKLEEKIAELLVQLLNYQQNYVQYVAYSDPEDRG